jgi:hypothetical protein
VTLLGERDTGKLLTRLRCHDYMMKEETDERNRCYDRTERFVNTSGSVSEEIFHRVPKRVFLTEKLQSFL